MSLKKAVFDEHVLLFDDDESGRDRDRGREREREGVCHIKLNEKL